MLKRECSSVKRGSEFHGVLIDGPREFSQGVTTLRFKGDKERSEGLNAEETEGLKDQRLLLRDVLQEYTCEGADIGEREVGLAPGSRVTSNAGANKVARTIRTILYLLASVG